MRQREYLFGRLSNYMPDIKALLLVGKKLIYFKIYIYWELLDKPVPISILGGCTHWSNTNQASRNYTWIYFTMLQLVSAIMSIYWMCLEMGKRSHCSGFWIGFRERWEHSEVISSMAGWLSAFEVPSSFCNSWY